jgi:hypothetical protein
MCAGPHHGLDAQMSGTTASESSPRHRRRLIKVANSVSDGQALIDLIKALTTAEEADGARAALAEVALDPAVSETARIPCCEALLLLGDIDRASIGLFDMLRDHRTPKWMRSRVASALASTGSKTAAAAALQDLAQDSSTPEEARADAAMILWTLGRPKAAMQTLWDLLETDTGSATRLEIAHFVADRGSSTRLARALSRLACDDFLDSEYRTAALSQLTRIGAGDAALQAARHIARSKLADHHLSESAAEVLKANDGPDKMLDLIRSCGSTPITDLLIRDPTLGVAHGMLRAVVEDPQVDVSLRWAAALAACQRGTAKGDADALVALLRSQGSIASWAVEAGEALSGGRFSDRAATLWSEVAASKEAAAEDRLDAVRDLLWADYHDLARPTAVEIASDSGISGFLRLSAAEYLEEMGATACAVETASVVASDGTQSADVVLRAAKLMLHHPEQTHVVPPLIRVANDREFDPYLRLDACEQLEKLGKAAAYRGVVRDIACDRANIHAAGRAVEMLIRRGWVKDLVEVCRYGQPGSDVTQKAAAALRTLLDQEELNHLARDDEVEGLARLTMIKYWSGRREAEVGLLAALAGSVKATGLARMLALRQLIDLGEERDATQLICGILSQYPNALWPGQLELPRGAARRRLLRPLLAQESIPPDVRLTLLEELSDDGDDDDAQRELVAMGLDNAVDPRVRAKLAMYTLPRLGYAAEAVRILGSLLALDLAPAGLALDVADAYCSLAGRHDVLRVAYDAKLAGGVRLRAVLEMRSRGYCGAVADALVELATLREAMASVRLQAAITAGLSLGRRRLTTILSSILTSSEAPDQVREAAAAQLAVVLS